MRSFVFTDVVAKFPGSGGWTYLPVPNTYTKLLNKRRAAWGMFPVRATVGETTWDTKLMMKKGGNYFVALKAAVRRAEQITVGDTCTVKIVLL